MSKGIGQWYMMRGDTDRDEGPPECPFCGHPVDLLSNGIYCCGDCEMSWDSLEALRADEIEPNGDDEE